MSSIQVHENVAFIFIESKLADISIKNEHTIEKHKLRKKCYNFLSFSLESGAMKRM